MKIPEANIKAVHTGRSITAKAFEESIHTLLYPHKRRDES